MKCVVFSLISGYEQQDAVEYFLDILEKVGPDLAKVVYFCSCSFNMQQCRKTERFLVDLLVITHLTETGL